MIAGSWATALRRRPGTCLRVAAATAGACWVAAGCGLLPSSEEKARERAPELHIGERREGWLRCEKGQCSNWYRLVLTEPTQVVFEADAPVDPLLPDFAMALRSDDLQLLAYSLAISCPISKSYRTFTLPEVFHLSKCLPKLNKL